MSPMRLMTPMTPKSSAPPLLARIFAGEIATYLPLNDLAHDDRFVPAPVDVRAVRRVAEDESLGALARSILRDVFAAEPQGLGGPGRDDAEAYREVAARLPNERFRMLLSEARRRLAHLDGEVVGSAIRSLLRRAGWDASHGVLRVDRPRLRGVHPGAHREPRAAAAYAPHRDTWYGNPQCQVNLWLALHDVAAGEAVRFFPSHFAKEVRNDSGAFDYGDFARLAGFQHDAPPREVVYPAAQEELERPAGVTLPRDGLLMFSAAHLHDTAPLVGARARFSVDLRVVPEVEHAPGRGAPNLDNLSRGDASADYPYRFDLAVPAGEVPR